MRVLNHFVALTFGLALALPAVAAPNPGRDWMLDGQSSKKTFVPDAPEGGNPDAGTSRSADTSMSGDANRGSAAARKSSAGKTLALTGSRNTKASGGALRVDLSALTARLKNGPVDFGSDNKPYFQLRYDGNGRDITFTAYRNGSLSAAFVTITEAAPYASKGDLLVSVAKVAKDGNAINGAFNGPAGSGGRLVSLN